VNLLIKTKLRVPTLRPHLLPRPDLAARVAAGLAGPLTLIAAPAGFGKTTVAAAGLARAGFGASVSADLTAAGAAAGAAADTAAGTAGGRAAWLSLDEGDNEARRFLAYLAAALQTVDPNLGRTAADLLQGPQIAPQEVVLAALVNDLADSGDLALVLDDYHVIGSSAVHAAVTFLIDHGPSSLHLLIATRADPPLPLARLRARGQLAELRAADLRFRPQETAAFLNDVMGLGLDANLMALLDERTEGWIAGLQLAALRLGGQGAGEAEAFIRHFSGAQRYILDYLLEEVLARQEPAVQRFLLLTAPLPRLCGPLCDAVLRAAGAENGDDPAAGRPLSGAALLAALEHTNVFLIPLDDDRRWYRYHHLFADLLRARLREWRPGLEGRLLAAAAAWLEEAGFTVEAVDTALAAGDPQWAARLVEQNTAGLLARGELGPLLGWIGALPAAVRRQRPALCIQQAYALAFAGQIEESAAALDVAAQSALDAAQEGATLAVRAMLAVMAGDDAEAVQLAQRALERLPASALWDRATANWALGYGRRSLGDLDTAQACFGEQIRLARVIPNVWTLVTGLTDLALVLRARGELRQARTLLEEALEAAAQEGARGLGYIARAETALAGVLCDLGELDAADRLLAGAFTHVGRWPNPNHIVYAHLVAAQVQQARGDFAAATASLRAAESVCRSAPVTTVLRRQVERLIEPAGERPAQHRLQAGLIEPLSERELEVLGLLAQGLSNQEIAARLIVAAGTVKAHTAAIYRKLDVANRTEAAARARRLGLVD